jgi:hypothetical protein
MFGLPLSAVYAICGLIAIAVLLVVYRVLKGGGVKIGVETKGVSLEFEPGPKSTDSPKQQSSSPPAAGGIHGVHISTGNVTHSEQKFEIGNVTHNKQRD